MRSVFLALSLSAVGHISTALAQETDPKFEAIPGEYIVEFDEAASKGCSGSQCAQVVDELFTALSSLGVEVWSLRNFTSELFSGVSIRLSDDADAGKLQEISVVGKVWPVEDAPRPEGQVRQGPRDAASRLKARDGGFEIPPDGPHLQTGVQKLHDAGILGEGVIVAVIDTGVDYMHPGLGGGIGPGFKVIGGYDFVGDEPTHQAPDDDPMDHDNGHGTHCAGIIAAEDEFFTGVAPKASILAYKTSSEKYLGRTDAILEAHIAAYEAGADVISVSLVAGPAWAYTPWALLAERIASRGIFVIIAAGNGGQMGSYMVNSGSTPEHVISVGSTDNDFLPGRIATVRNGNDTGSSLPYISYTGLPWGDTWGPASSGLQLYAAAADETFGDGCELLPEDGWNNSLHHRVILVRRPKNCHLSSVGASAVARGSRFLIIINDERPVFQPFTWPAETENALITKEEGDSLEERLLRNETIFISFPESPIHNFNGGFNQSKTSWLTNWGLSYENTIKPNVLAPGGLIFSTYPRALSSYAIHTGTSMSTPYLAGVAALYLSAHGGRAALGVNGTLAAIRRLSSAGTPLAWNPSVLSLEGVPEAIFTDKQVDLSVLAPVAQQGAGQINADTFVRSKIELSPNRLELNHTGANALRTRFNIDITNHGSEPVTFKASHLPALSSYAFDSGPTGGITYPLPEVMDDKRAQVILASESITVCPDATAVLRLRILPPTGFKEPERLPSFGGYIALEGSNGEKLYVPYAGIAIDGKTIDPFGPRDLTWLRSSTSQPITEETTVNLAQGDGIYTVSETRWGSAVWRTDVIEADYPVPRLQWPGVPGRNGLVGTVDEQQWVGRDIYGMTTRTNLPSQFLNGTVIPSGRYRYVTRALRPFWSEGERGAWEVRASPVINVVRGE